MNGNAEAAGAALFDTLYRRQSKVLGSELPHETGERYLRNLERRGYRVIYDPALAAAAAERGHGGYADPPPPAVRVPRLEEPSVEDVRAYSDVMPIIAGARFVCDCGCNVFRTLGDGIYLCNVCDARYHGVK